MCKRNSHHLLLTYLKFKKQGSLCREVETDCDVPEYCTGDSGDVSIALRNALTLDFFTPHL